MFYQLKEIWAIREQINRSPIIKILVIILSHSLQKLGILSPRVQWRKWTLASKALRGLVSVALGSLLAPLVGEKH